MKRIMLLALLLGTGLAHAHGIKVAVPDNPAWKEECGSCHIAYPPQFLSVNNWERLMQGLDRHFGENAALDPQVNQQILGFLKQYGSNGPKYSAKSLRISETPWFRGVHAEVPKKAWAHPAVKSPANCAACHVKAEGGDWSERSVRMPGGLREEEGENEGDEGDD